MVRVKIIINKYNSELSLFDDNYCKLTYLSCNGSKRDCQDNGPLTNLITPRLTVTIDLLLPTRSQSGDVPSGCTGIAP